MTAAQSFQTASSGLPLVISRCGFRSRKSGTRKAFGSTGNASPDLVTPSHPQDKVLSTEPLVIPVHLSGGGIRQLLLLLDSGTNVPFLYDPGKYLAPGLSVRAPLRNRSADGVERAFTVLPPQDMQIGILAFRQISFVSLADTGKDLLKWK